MAQKASILGFLFDNPQRWRALRCGAPRNHICARHRGRRALRRTTARERKKQLLKLLEPTLASCSRPSGSVGCAPAQALKRLASGNVKPEGLFGARGRPIGEFELAKAQVDAFGRRISGLRRSHADRGDDHVGHLKEKEFPAALAGLTVGQRPVRNTLILGASREQQWGREVDQLLKSRCSRFSCDR